VQDAGSKSLSALGSFLSGASQDHGLGVLLRDPRSSGPRYSFPAREVNFILVLGMTATPDQ
jgi:hypothetical protein